MMSEERKAFEAWFEGEAMPYESSLWFKLDESGDYVVPEMREYWGVWKAARADLRNWDKGFEETRQQLKEAKRSAKHYKDMYKLVDATRVIQLAHINKLEKEASKEATCKGSLHVQEASEVWECMERQWGAHYWEKDYDGQCHSLVGLSADDYPVGAQLIVTARVEGNE